MLESISFEARNGDFVAIVGPSGCGKTSILRVIGGLIGRTDVDAEIKGEVFIDGMTPRDARQVRTFGFTFQNRYCFVAYSARQRTIAS